MKIECFIIVLVGSILLLTGCESSSDDYVLQQNNLESLAHNINSDFFEIRLSVDTLAQKTASLYQRKNEIIPTVNPDDYALHENGVLYKKKVGEGTAVFVSGNPKVDDAVKEEVYLTVGLDNDLVAMVHHSQAVAQAYYNSKFSLNRIFPGFDVLSQYPPGMDITAYNFYYLADGEHNPDKKALWIKEPYVDPAGRGWMVSAIAPVYLENTLQGVAGLDVTVNTLLKRYLPAKNTNTIIVDHNGKLIAGSSEALFLFGMPFLKEYQYNTTIKKDMILGEDYTIQQSKNQSLRTAVNELLEKNTSLSHFTKTGRNYVLLHSTIKELNWIILQAIEVEKS